MGAACCSDMSMAPSTLNNGEVAAPQPADDAAHPKIPTAAATQITSGQTAVPMSQAVGQAGRSHDEADDGESSGGSQLTPGVSTVGSAEDQRKQARSMVKEFTKEMVKGKKMNVMMRNGQLKSCTCSLSRALDELKIKVGGTARTIALKDVEGINAGVDVEGIATPVDELCATLMLASDDCITFRMPDINARDTFTMCLTMFCNGQK